MRKTATRYIPIVESDTVINPWTMVIKMVNASITNAAMLAANWLQTPTRMTKPLQGVHTIFPLIIVSNLAKVINR